MNTNTKYFKILATSLIALGLPAISAAATINTNSSILVVNEFLADGTTNGDANGDGVISSVDDEFVEIVNISNAALDISGFSIWESGLATARHIFPSGTVLNPYEPIVVFGGGTPTGFGSIQTQIATNADPGINFGLNLSNSADQVILRDASSAVVFDVSYDSNFDAIADESLTMSPDLSGVFAGHTTAIGSIGAFSPGTLADGSDFAAPVPVPAAAWLFASALGLLGWIKRRGGQVE